MTLAISFYHLEIKGILYRAVRQLLSFQEKHSFTFFYNHVSYSLFFFFTGSYSFIACVFVCTCVHCPPRRDRWSILWVKIECNSITNFILITNFPLRLLRSLLFIQWSINFLFSQTLESVSLKCGVISKHHCTFQTIFCDLNLVHGINGCQNMSFLRPGE